MRRLASVISITMAALGLSGRVAAESTSMVVPGSGSQHALAVSIGSGQIHARACVAGSSCASTGGATWSLPATALASKATINAVALAGDKGIAVVRVPLKGGGAWVLLVAASNVTESPTADKKLSGTLDVARGPLHGERFTRVLIQDKTPDGTRLIVGKRYEHATVCGRPATIAARELDPVDMTWRKTYARSLTPGATAGATAITARRASAKFDVDGPNLLNATVASSAVGRSRSGMTDQNLTTRWAENRPGPGKGEFISMNGSEDVAVTGFDIVVRQTGSASPRGGAPKTFFIATTSEVFHITMPEDAWLAEAGQSYQILLPRPVKSDCFALVLEEGFTEEERDQIGLAELRARTEFDGKSFAELAELLRGNTKQADAVRALLMRSGPLAAKAVMAAYSGLDRLGKGRAVEVVESGNCSDTATFYVDRLLGRGVDLKDFEPALAPLARRAHANLLGCRGAATIALVAALAAEAPGKRRVIAARELADIAPASAVAAILEVVPDGSTAPASSGADDSVRRGLRGALATAVKHRRAKRAIDELLQAVNFGNLSLLQQIDLLRALDSQIAAHQPAAGIALHSIFTPSATFRTRYLLLPAAAHLARARDKAALELVRTSLLEHKSAHIRARAAAVAGGTTGLASAMLTALGDKSPRVREAALTGLQQAGPIEPRALARVSELLTEDRWTFVRLGAALALARQPTGNAADSALMAALEDKSNKVRRAVLRALGERRTTAAGEKIHDIADNPKEPVSVRTTAVASLGALCRNASTELLYKLAIRAGYQQLPYDQPIGLAALSALGELKPRDLAERLAPLLKKGGHVPGVIRSITRDVLTRSGSCN